MKKFNVVLIGAGSIGAMKPDDLDGPDKEYALTHASALYKLKSYFNLVCIVDNNYEMAIKASEKWGCGSSQYLGFLTAEFRKSIDVAVIAVNTENHLSMVQHSIVNFPNLKMIVLEKPCGDSTQECYQILSKSSENRFPIAVAVNYTRRYEPFHRIIASNILDGKYGKIYSARFHYTRGLKRDGCHAIDLANWFFGKCISAEKHSNFHIDDYSKEDLTIPVVAEYERCPLVTFNPCDGRKYSIFELEILTEKGKISIYESGQKIMLVKPSPDNVYGKYNSLKYDLNVTETTTRLKESLIFLYRDVYNYLTTGEDVSCNLNDALSVHKFIGAIRREE